MLFQSKKIETYFVCTIYVYCITEYNRKTKFVLNRNLIYLYIRYETIQLKKYFLNEFRVGSPNIIHNL